MTRHPRLSPLPGTDRRTPDQKAHDALTVLPDGTACRVLAEHISRRDLPAAYLRDLARWIDRRADERERDDDRR